MLLSAACMLGYGIQLGRTRRSVLVAQEARLAREHAAETQQAVRDEKSRIARELHDVVAHNVSVITAQATGAQRVFDTEPELARDALRSIETTGRGALTEMRRLLGVLQLESDNAAIEPQPGLDQLPYLIAQMERSGLPVDLQVSGEPRPLSSGVQLNAYRIVQEALTNTLKHAGPSCARVELHYRPDHLDVRVADNGRGFNPDAVPGHGVIGMRQRAAMLGGQLSVLPGAAGGVLVTASLPTET
jgi:signal transduction histidine kinase